MWCERGSEVTLNSPQSLALNVHVGVNGLAPVIVPEARQMLREVSCRRAGANSGGTTGCPLVLMLYYEPTRGFVLGGMKDGEVWS